MPEHTPIDVPAAPADYALPAALTSGQEEMRKKVLDHFTNVGYHIPGIEEKGELTDDEKFWLVCFRGISCFEKRRSYDAAISRLSAYYGTSLV